MNSVEYLITYTLFFSTAPVHYCIHHGVYRLPVGAAGCEGPACRNNPCARPFRHYFPY